MVKWNELATFGTGLGGHQGGSFVVAMQLGPFTLTGQTIATLPRISYDQLLRFWQLSPQEMAMPNKTADYTGTITTTGYDGNNVQVDQWTTTISLHIDAIATSDVVCSTGWTYDEPSGLCVPPPGTPTGPITPIIKPPTPGFPQLPSSINLIDWLKWLGQIIQWFVGQLWVALGDALSYLLNLAWSLLPEWAQTGIGSFVKTWQNIIDFFEAPGVFYRKHAAALFEAGSGTPVGIYAGGNQQEVKRLAQEARGSMGPSFDVAKMIQDAINSAGDTITSPFDTAVSVETADNAAKAASLAALGIITTATAINAAVEMIPTINATGVAFMTGAILQSTGIGGYLSDYFGKKYDANIGVQLGYFWNEKYQNKIESISNLISKRRKGLITNEEFTRAGIRVTGQTLESVRLDYKDSLQVPGFEDAVTYKVRHPTEAVDFGSLQDLLGINYNDYKKYFDERQFGDVSIRFIQSAANLLGFTETQVRELLRLNRLDPRKNDVLGMSPLDVAVKVMMSRKETYDETLTVKEERTKHFTYSLLIKLAEAGEDITGFMDADLTAEGWDQAHRTVLEDYINKTIAAKAAKKPAA